MSPLEAAHRINERSTIRPSCWFCGTWKGKEHAEECPVPALPQIVTALDAVAAMLYATDPGTHLYHQMKLAAALGLVAVSYGEGNALTAYKRPRAAEEE